RSSTRPIRCSCVGAAMPLMTETAGFGNRLPTGPRSDQRPAAARRRIVAGEESGRFAAGGSTAKSGAGSRWIHPQRAREEKLVGHGQKVGRVEGERPPGRQRGSGPPPG